MNRHRQQQRAEIKRGMVFARMWKQFHHFGYVDGQLCVRCDGATIVWWCGKPGEGGRRGPCPRCQVEGANRYRKMLAREVFG